MVDDASLRTLEAADRALREVGLRDGVTLAFAGGVTAAHLHAAHAAGAEVVDVGRAIIDAPLWDLHLELAP
jgi:nicotinate-nucleotide pyrophosphorylase (carboxylating)